LYENLRRPREARGELDRVLSDKSTPVDATFPRKLAYYHLGRINQLEGAFDKAKKSFEDATRVDQDYIEAHVALGDLHLERAFLLSAQAGPSAGGAGGG